jgi:hypothetical protein
MLIQCVGVVGLEDRKTKKSISKKSRQIISLQTEAIRKVNLRSKGNETIHQNQFLCETELNHWRNKVKPFTRTFSDEQMLVSFRYRCDSDQ